jgi:hypothetical protein
MAWHRFSVFVGSLHSTLFVTEREPRNESRSNNGEKDFFNLSLNVIENKGVIAKEQGGPDGCLKTKGLCEISSEASISYLIPRRLDFQ